MDFHQIYTARFELGKIVVFPGVEWLVEEEGSTVEDFIERHSEGDWGHVSDEVWAINDRAARQGGRISSHYDLPESGRTLLITTDEDRMTTWLYLSEED